MKITKASLAILTLAFSGATTTLWGVESSEGSKSFYDKWAARYDEVLKDYKQATVNLRNGELKPKAISKAHDLLRHYAKNAQFELSNPDSQFHQILKQRKVDKSNAQRVIRLSLNKWIKNSPNMETIEENAKESPLNMLYSKNPVLEFILMEANKDDYITDRRLKQFLDLDFSSYYIDECTKIQTPLIELCKKVVHSDGLWNTSNIGEKERERNREMVEDILFRVKIKNKSQDEILHSLLICIGLLQFFIKHKTAHFKEAFEPQDGASEYETLQKFIEITQEETERVEDIVTFLTIFGFAIHRNEVCKKMPNVVKKNIDRSIKTINDFIKETKKNPFGSMTHDVLIRHQRLIEFLAETLAETQQDSTNETEGPCTHPYMQFFYTTPQGFTEKADIRRDDNGGLYINHPSVLSIFK